jgi:hypothetical protein
VIESSMINPETVLGAIIFALIKLAGYWFLAQWLGRYYRPHEAAAPITVALSRIVLGALVGGFVALSFRVETNIPWYLLLVLVRAVEWALVFWFFYERLTGDTDWRRLALFACFGTVVSCVLDLPAVFSAVVIPLMFYGFC